MSVNYVEVEEWRKNPFKASKKFQTLQEAGEFDPGFLEKILKKFKRNEEELTREQKMAISPFVDFLSEGDYHSASIIAGTVLEDSPVDVGGAVETRLLEIVEDHRWENSTSNLKEVFSLLESFDHVRDVVEIRGELSYIETEGMRLIDQAATDLWNELDASSRAFFEKYVREESEAVILAGDGEELEGSYMERALEAYEDALGQDPLNAMNIAERFELGDQKLEEAEERYRLMEAVREITEGDVPDLDEEELSDLREDVSRLNEGGMDISRFDNGNRFEKKIGNFLTDEYLWRRNPEKAQEAGYEDLDRRLELFLEGRRGSKPSERQKKRIFTQLMDNGEFFAAAKYAETAGLEVDRQLEDEVMELVGEEEYRKAFAALDSFDYDKTVSELMTEGHFDQYLTGAGPEALIDRLASDVWKDLGGAPRAFFQMYVDGYDDSPSGFEPDTVATVYSPVRSIPRGEGVYKEDAFLAYQQAERNGENEQAEHILDRFDIDPGI